MISDCVHPGPEQERVFALGSTRSAEPFRVFDGHRHVDATLDLVEKLPDALKRSIHWCTATWKVHGKLVFVDVSDDCCNIYDMETSKFIITSYVYEDHFGEIYVLRRGDSFKKLDRAKWEIHPIEFTRHCRVNEFTSEVICQDEFNKMHPRYSWSVENGVVYFAGVFIYDKVARETYVRRLTMNVRARGLHMWKSYMYVDGCLFDINSDLKRCLMLFRCLPQEIKNRIYSFLRICV